MPDRLVEMGRKGQKTGAGWYRYEKGDRTPHPDEVVKSVIADVAKEFGIPQRTFTDEEILRRLLLASVNEACKILEEGKAYRASDIDVMWLHGFGFPRYRGGLMFWADTIGVAGDPRPDRGVARTLWRALEGQQAAARDRVERRKLARCKGTARVRCDMSAAFLGCKKNASGTSLRSRVADLIAFFKSRDGQCRSFMESMT